MRPAARRWDQVVYWSLDLETGGLNPRVDPILAVGMVPVRDGAVRIGEAYTSLVRPEQETPPKPGSIGAHHILPSEVRSASDLEPVLRQIDERLAEGVLLAHHAPLDLRFIKRAHARMGRRWTPPPAVDTVRLLQKWASYQLYLGGLGPDPTMNLTQARAGFGLPSYPAHDALTDAVATAELFLLLRARLNARTLADLL
jgi:DNA polymerase-3 subunit epsilon